VVVRACRLLEQAAGNVHVNIASLFLSVVLLLPGGVFLLWSFFGLRLPLAMLVGVILAVNFLAWAAVRKRSGSFIDPNRAA
jgi:hypothetical protein